MNRIGTLLLCCAAILLASCGGNSAGTIDSRPAVQNNVDVAQAGQGSELPSLNELEIANRDVSILGPGWYPVSPFQIHGRNMGENIAPFGDDRVKLTSTNDPAFMIYGVNGFDGDNFPTSIRTEVENLTHEYYAVVADFSKQRWEYLGPYTGKAEIMLPDEDGQGLGSRYVNEFNNFWFGLTIGPQPDGAGDGEVDIRSLEIGVHGGGDGPKSPLFFLSAGTGGETSINVTWLHSADFADPDFAGYYLERAPATFGSFERLNDELIKTNGYLDEGLQPDTLYRYRAAAVDVSGNMSAWNSGIASTYAGDIPLPVVVIDMPNGPFEGSAQIAVDLAGSYDPEGAEIVGWTYTTLEVDGAPLANGGGKISLKPGCHQVLFEVETADGRIGSATTIVKVYPKWDSEPVLVHDDSALPVRRFDEIRMAIEPGSGNAVFFGLNRIINSFQFWREANGGFELVGEIPFYGELLNGVSELVPVGDSMVCATNWDDNNVQYAVMTGDEVTRTSGPNVGSSPGIGFGISLVSTGSDAVLFYSYDQNPGLDIYYSILSEGPVGQLLLAGQGDTRMRSCFSDANGEIYLMHLLAGEVRLSVINANTMGVNNTFQVDPGAAGNVDMGCVIDPDNGLPVSIWKDNASGDYESSRMIDSSLGNFEAVQKIDPSLTNYLGACFAGGPQNVYAFFAGNDTITDGQSRLYSFDGGGWSERNVVSYFDNSGFISAMTVRGDGTAVVADQANNQSIYLSDQTAAPSESVLYVFPEAQQIVSNLRAIGSDRLFVAWDATINFADTVYTSEDNGATWLQSGFPDAIVNDTKFCVTSTGELYASYSVANLAVLCYWNEGLGIWQTQLTEGITPGQLALNAMPKNSPFESITWTVYDNAGETAIEWRGNYDTGVPLNDFTDTVYMPEGFPYYPGAVGVADFSRRYTFSHGGSLRDVHVLQNIDALEETEILIPAMNTNIPFRILDRTIGRTLAGVHFLGESLLLPDAAVICSHGDAGPPVRHEISILSNDTTTEIDGWPLVDFVSEYRRTVSCELAHGATGLSLISAWDGSRHQLQWSNFGEWENIPMPEIKDTMMMPELAVDADGNWHIFYYDRESTHIKVISSTD